MTTVFVDLGAAGSLIDHAYAAQLGVRLKALSQLVSITAVDSWSFNPSPRSHFTSPIHLIVADHHEKIQRLLFTSYHTRSPLALPSRPPHFLEAGDNSSTGSNMSVAVSPG